MNNQLRDTLPIKIEEFPEINHGEQLHEGGIYGIYRNGGNIPSYSRYFAGIYNGYHHVYGHEFYIYYQKELSKNWRLERQSISIRDDEINDRNRWIIYELPEYFRNRHSTIRINPPDLIFSQHEQENYAINSNNSNMAFNSMARNFGSNVGTGSGVYGNIAEFLGSQNMGGKKKRKTKKLRKGKKTKRSKKSLTKSKKKKGKK